MRFNPGLATGFAEETQALDQNGRVISVINWPLTREEFEQLRTGWRCLNCMEPFPSAFPDVCGICGFHVKQDQAFEFAKNYLGTHRYGPSEDD